ALFLSIKGSTQGLRKELCKKIKEPPNITYYNNDKEMTRNSAHFQKKNPHKRIFNLFVFKGKPILLF
ncbi:MAG: hypothetical protein IKC60_01370, partial [Clostridia bacterium]|nr:hypothetical protein [Clostridia bacterium]